MPNPPLPTFPAKSPESCRFCGRVFEDERDRVKDEHGVRCIADGKCHDRATVQMVALIGEQLR